MYRSDRIIIRYFPRFRNRFFPGSNFSSSYRRTFYQVFRIFVKSRNLKIRVSFRTISSFFSFTGMAFRKTPYRSPCSIRQYTTNAGLFEARRFVLGIWNELPHVSATAPFYSFTVWQAVQTCTGLLVFANSPLEHLCKNCLLGSAPRPRNILFERMATQQAVIGEPLRKIWKTDFYKSTSTGA